VGSSAGDALAVLFIPDQHNPDVLFDVARLAHWERREFFFVGNQQWIGRSS
jgi:hypothetical protein